MNDQRPLASTDIMLLMENYQNIMQMNTILQQQQKQLIDLQNKLVDKQEQILKDQGEVVRELASIGDKLLVCSKNLEETNKSIKNCCDNMEQSISGKLTSMNKGDEAWRLDVVKQHAGINKNVYVAWGAMGTIVLGTIALLITAYEKYAILEEVSKLINQLVQYFHLG